MTDNADGQKLRAYAVERLERKRKFFADAGAYATVNGLLWAIWAIFDRSTGGVPWPAWVSIIWGFFLLLDGLRLLRVWSRMTRPITDADVDREIRRLGGRA